MPTATANRAPTEAEIREAIEAGLKGHDALDLASEAYKATRAVDYYPEDALLEPLADNPHNRVWRNLRPSEANRLSTLLEAAMHDLAERWERELIEAVTRAAMQFAAEYPDAPRVGVSDSD